MNSEIKVAHEQAHAVQKITKAASESLVVRNFSYYARDILSQDVRTNSSGVLVDPFAARDMLFAAQKKIQVALSAFSLLNWPDASDYDAAQGAAERPTKPYIPKHSTDQLWHEKQAAATDDSSTVCDPISHALTDRPSKSFTKFAQFVVSEELNRAKPSLPREVEKRLWAAAQFDALMSTGGLPSLDRDNDCCGFLLVFDGQYKTAIRDTLEPLVSWYGDVA